MLFWEIYLRGKFVKKKDERLIFGGQEGGECEEGSVLLTFVMIFVFNWLVGIWMFSVLFFFKLFILQIFLYLYFIIKKFKEYVRQRGC